MKRKAKTTVNGALWLEDSQKAAMRMQAIQVAAHLPEPRGGGFAQGIGGGYPVEPGKSAAKVVADAEAIMAFVTKA